MLMVSDMLELATGRTRPVEVTARAPARYQTTADAPFVVVWNVCRHCNMTCPHCYAAAGPRASRQDLSTEEGRRLIDELAEAGVRYLIFSGGEPLLRDDLLELVAHARDRGVAPQLSSNGVLIDAETAARLAGAGVTYVGVSIDGLPAFNDAYRGLADGFTRAVQGIVHAQRAGMRTGLRTTVTRRNAEQLEAMIDLAREIPVDRFYVSHLVYSGRGRRLADADLAPSDARALLHRYFERAEALLEAGEERPKLVTGGNDSDGPALVRWIERRMGTPAAQRVHAVLERRGGNSAGERVLCIDHRGRVHPDQFWQAATLGDVRRQPFVEILAHPLREQLRRREAQLGGRCGTCPFKAICRGSHRERALVATGDPWAPDPACVMTDAEVQSATLEATA
ncbi:MAG: radical SAM protein [Myxococcota bacterium]